MNHIFSRDIRRIGFVSTRIAGTDGVSLEIAKWTDVLEKMGYECCFICGKSDRPSDRTALIELADLHHPIIRDLTYEAFGSRTRSRELSTQLHNLSSELKQSLYSAVERMQVDCLIAENILTIPMHIPLGAAMVELLLETEIPGIAHHHDFYWERERYLINCVPDYLGAVFPPPLAELEHVVISTVAAQEFSRRTGLSSRVIPNVMDFDHPPDPPDEYIQDFRQELGIGEDDLLILQPTRIVQRKGIEHTIELVRRLEEPRCKLVVTHDGQDEGDGYVKRIKEYARLLGVTMILAEDRIGPARGTTADGRKVYSIWDAYPHADFVSFPSTYEGFGNAFLEAIYFRKPVFCNRYSIFQADIEPCGFRTVTMNGYLTDDAVDLVRSILHSPELRAEMTEHNYNVARQYFSYDRVEHELRAILERPRPAPCPDRADPAPAAQ